MGFSQEDESEKPEAAWENPVLVIVRGIKYNESYKMLTGGICMGSYLNPGNEAFAVALNSEIYVDKTGLLTYTNKVMNTLQGYICNSRPRRFGKSFAANMLAAYYSRGRGSENVPVDYTERRFVRKPSGAKPGMVIYTTNKTAYVTPDPIEVKAIIRKQ